jgi:hypothetical protein
VIVRAIGGFLRFWFDFIVGDDWRIAVGIAVLVGVGGWLVHDDVVRTSVIAVGVPVVLVAVVAASIAREARSLSRPRG